MNAYRQSRFFWYLLKETASRWWYDNTFRMAAALAFYTIFSLAPVLIVAIGIGGILLNEADLNVRSELSEQMTSLVGENGSKALEQIISSAGVAARTPQALVISCITILVGSTMVFVELQADLDEIWRVEPTANANMVWQVIVARLRSFGIVLIVGLLMVSSLVLSAALSLFQRQLGAWLPQLLGLGNYLDTLLWILLMSVLFALIYRILPDVKLSWRHVLLGSIVTALLFTFGKYILGLYLGYASYGSTYGAAGSLVVFLIWVYYSALIFLFGAEFTCVYSRSAGERVEIVEFAESADEDAGEKSGKSPQVPAP